MEPTNENLLTNEGPVKEKERHGCVTAWLVFIIVINSILALVYLLASDMITNNLPNPPSKSMILLLGLLGLANVVFAVLLLKWKKIAFLGFVATGVAACGINISIGLGIGQSLFGLVGIGVLYGILQIKKDEVSAWDNME